jgi:phage protein D
MSQVDLSKKYADFLTPKKQIIVNNEDIMQKYCISSLNLAVEQILDDSTKFNFSIDDPQAKWSNMGLFEIEKTVEIKMGYDRVLETVVIGKVTAIKTIFPQNRAPIIEVFGEKKKANTIASAPINFPVYSLAYGNTLLSFTVVNTNENQHTNTQIVNRETTINVPNSRCNGECIGLPDIKPGVNIALSRLGNKYNQIYFVEKAIHNWDKNLGFRTLFEAKR